MTTFNDVLTNILVTANYPDVKREGFIRTFYEYLLVKILDEVNETQPELYQKLMAYFSDESSSDREIQEGLQEAYQNPEIKGKIDKVMEEVMSELSSTILNSASEEQKEKIEATVKAAQAA